MHEWRNSRVNLRALLRGVVGVSKTLTCVCAALTQTEAKIAALVTDGLTNREVATELGVGVKTVETHLAHVFRKLGISSRDELRPGIREKCRDA